MLALVLVYQQVENHLLQPTIVGRAARVSGFFVLASVLVFGALFGRVGAVQTETPDCVAAARTRRRRSSTQQASRPARRRPVCSTSVARSRG
jgi:hypothetical protein